MKSQLDFQAAFGRICCIFHSQNEIHVFLNDGIDAATNGKWVSRRLRADLGLNLIMFLLVRLFANKVERQSALFCKMDGYGFFMQ